MSKQCCLDNWKTLKLLFAASSEHIRAWTQASNINDIYITVVIYTVSISNFSVL